MKYNTYVKSFKNLMSLYCLALEQPKAKLPRLDISLEKSRDLAEVTLWRNSASRASTGQEGQHRQVHRYAAALLWRKSAREPTPGGTIGKARGLHQRRQVHRYAVTLQKGRKFDWDWRTLYLIKKGCLGGPGGHGPVKRLQDRQKSGNGPVKRLQDRQKSATPAEGHL